MRYIYASLLVLAAVVCTAQTKTNPVLGINWPQATGLGAPSASCTLANYGQPYTDRTNSSQYICEVPGWVKLLNADGTGATGTWPISISGNAATATLATNASNLSGSPAITVSSVTASGLTAGLCVQTTTGGLLTTSGSACGAGGGGSVTTTGSPVSGNLTKFSGASSITVGNLSGDATTSGTLAVTLATVNTNTGSWGSSTAIPVITLNGKGLATAASTVAVIAPAGTLTGTTLASNVVSSSLTSAAGGTLGTGAYATIANYALVGGSNASGSWPISVTGSAGTLASTSQCTAGTNYATGINTAGVAQCAAFSGVSAGTAAVATAITVTGGSASASTLYPVFVNSSNTTGNYGALNTAALTYVPSTGTLSSTTFAGAHTGHSSLDCALSGCTMTGTLAGTTVTASTQFIGPGTGLTGTATSLSIGGSAGTAGSVTSAVTFNSSGTGAASGTTFNGSGAVTVSYNTIGAQVAGSYSPLAGSSSITTLGTITAGVWNGTAIANAYLANSGTTVNSVSCALGSTCTVTAAAGTLTGTTLNSTVVTSSLTAVGTIATGVWHGTAIANAYLANSSTTVNGVACTLGGTCTVSGAVSNAVTFDNSGTGAVSGTTYDGSTARTISYNTVGAQVAGSYSPLAGSSSIVTVGTLTAGSIPYSLLSGTVPTWNQNTIGTAGGLSSTLVTSSGGSGNAGTLTGVLYGNGTSAYTVATSAQVQTTIGSGVYSPTAGNTSLVTVGTITTGIWNAGNVTTPVLYTTGISLGSNYVQGIALYNSTQATSGVNYSSPYITETGYYWDGSVSQSDAWKLLASLGTGANPTSTFTLTHTGSTGVAGVSIPYPVSVGALTVTSCTGCGGGTTTNAVTFNNSGSGAASGTTFNGSSAQTISYNTIGAQAAGSYSPLAGSSSITTVGTITSGVWSAGTITTSAATITTANVSVLLGTGTAVTLTLGAGAGSGASVLCLSTCTATSGSVDISTGTTPTVNQAILSITFPVSGQYNCAYQLGPSSGSAAMPISWGNAGAPTFVVTNRTTALAAGVDYILNYVCAKAS